MLYFSLPGYAGSIKPFIFEQERLNRYDRELNR